MIPEDSYSGGDVSIDIGDNNGALRYRQNQQLLAQEDETVRNQTSISYRATLIYIFYLSINDILNVFRSRTYPVELMQCSP